MQWLTTALSFAGGLIAAAVGAYVAVRTNRQRMAADVRARWDSALLDRGDAFAAATRSLRHLAERLPHSDDHAGLREPLDEAHQRMRVACEQLRLLGNRRVQVAARAVLHHAYAVRVLGEQGHDPRAADYPGRTPVNRLNDSLQEFYRAVREQLGAQDPEAVLHDDDLATPAPAAGPADPG